MDALKELEELIKQQGARALLTPLPRVEAEQRRKEIKTLVQAAQEIKELRKELNKRHDAQLVIDRLRLELEEAKADRSMCPECQGIGRVVITKGQSADDTCPACQGTKKKGGE